MDLAVQSVIVGQSEESLKRLDVKLAETNRKVEIAEELYREMATQSEIQVCLIGRWIWLMRMSS